MKDLLMLGVYDQSSYSRGRVIYEGLKENKIDVEIATTIGKNKYCQLVKRILKKDCKKLFVTGKFVLLLSWLLKPLHRKEIIFDAFISDYDTLVKDRQVVKDKSIKAKILRLGDKYSCAVADKIITDTPEHAEYFIEEFGARRDKFNTIYIGADNKIFFPKKAKKKNKKLIVEFHGTFIPLQGIDVILKAAKRLEKEKDVVFRIIGGGQTYDEMVLLHSKLKLKNTRMTGLKPINEVNDEINGADVCLGIFGTTDKAKRVIPNKAYEVIACKKPLITGDTRAIRRFFKDKENCVLSRIGDEKNLAEQIMLLKRNKNLRDMIATKGRQLYEQNFTNKEIVKGLIKIIRS